MKLSIGIVCYPSLGGSGVVASELAVGLARRGHDVHLIATSRPGRAAGCPNLAFHEVAVPDYPVFEHAPYSLAVATKIVDVARAHRLQLLDVHYAVPHATSAYLARQILGAEAPCIVTSLHGTDVTHMGAHPSYRAVTSFAVTASDGITAPSSWLRAEAHARLDVPPDAIEVMPNFVDTEKFTPAERREPARLQALFSRPVRGPVLFHVSNFRPVKRVGDLLEVLLRIRRETPARLVLVGDGPERAGAEERAVALGLGDDVCFLGNRADFVDLLRDADGFLLTSESESFGVAALEAMSAGVPVFAYRVGGLPDVIVDGVGRLVPLQDIEALARAVLEVVTAPRLQAELARAAREHVVASFRLEPALDRYEEYFRRLLARGSR